MPVFEACNLEFHYPNSNSMTLVGIDFSVNEGQCLGLIGPNGAGKSTLLSILSGLLIPTSGKVSFFQPPHISLSQFVQNKIALVPQEYAFYPQLSVSQNLHYFVSLCGLKRAECAEVAVRVLEQCQLNDVQDQVANSLSGGYKRRLNLAIGLLKDPQILYLDEPTVGVDPISRETIISLLKSLKEQGKTIVYTSHLLSEVEDICDQIIMLNKGRANYWGLNNTLKTLSVEFESTVPSAWLDKLSEIHLKTEVIDNKARIKVESQAMLRSVLSLLNNCHLPIQNIHYDDASLTQYYLSQMADDD